MTMNATLSNLIHRVNVGDSLTRSAWRRPDALALVDMGRTYSYREFNNWVNRIAHGLLQRGYVRGDVIALVSGNSAEFLITYYACAKIGVVTVPINLGWKSDEVAYALGHSSARGVVIEPSLLGRYRDAVSVASKVAEIYVLGDLSIAPDSHLGKRTLLTFGELEYCDESEPEVFVDDRDPITYLYTSGTTSAPKGVIGNHTAIYLESMSIALEAKFAEDDRFVAMMPMFHTAQLNVHCTAAIMVGATIFVHRGFEAGRLLQTIESQSITQIFGLPMMYREMLGHASVAERNLSSLRRALYAMAPMPQDLLQQCIDVFDCDFYLLFGQTEMSPTTTIFRPEHQLTHNGAAGSQVVNVQTAIMDDDGKLVDRGVEGEIVYRGPHALTGYLDDPAATSQAFRHGWFHSGDIGRVDDDGVLWFVDRSKDVIKTGGENVSSIEVEKAIYAANPDIAEVTVIGLPHARWSEAITAIVVPHTGTTIDASDLVRTVKSLIDPYKAPKSVVLIDELPKTSTGKIQKNVLRQRFASHYE